MACLAPAALAVALVAGPMCPRLDRPGVEVLAALQGEAPRTPSPGPDLAEALRQLTPSPARRRRR